jgi:hypothetical protein
MSPHSERLSSKDIIERLRARYDWNKPCNALCLEAANEIERLRALVKTLVAELNPVSK